MCIPWGRASTLPCGCTIVSWLLLLCLCILSLPWLTFEFALWNSGKVKEAEAYFLQTRNVKHRKTSMPRILTASCEVSVTNCYLYVKDLYLFALFDVAGIAKRLSIVKNLLFLVSHSVMSNSLWPPRLQQARLPCPSPSPGVCSNSGPLSQWCHPNISSSVIPSPLAFNLSQHQGLFQWVSFSNQVAKILELQHQSFQLIDWFPLGMTSLILQSKGISRVFSKIIVQRHLFFSAQLSLCRKTTNI